MPVIAVVNRKGGSGKSTLATHMAAALAHRGLGVMLGDADLQASTSAWLRRRAALALPGAAIVGRSIDPRSVLRVPVGVSHTVLDTPGGLQGFDLARCLIAADVVLIPVCASTFDLESAAACYGDLSRHPRVASGRCRVAAIGMRVDARTQGGQAVRDWAAALGLPVVGVLRETQVYVRCADRGLSIFDLPPARVQADLDQWRPILAWLDTTFKDQADKQSTSRRPSAPSVSPVPTDRPPSDVPCLAPAPPALEPSGLRRLWRWLVPRRPPTLRTRL